MAASPVLTPTVRRLRRVMKLSGICLPTLNLQSVLHDHRHTAVPRALHFWNAERAYVSAAVWFACDLVTLRCRHGRPRFSGESLSSRAAHRFGAKMASDRSRLRGRPATLARSRSIVSSAAFAVLHNRCGRPSQASQLLSAGQLREKQFRVLSDRNEPDRLRRRVVGSSNHSAGRRQDSVLLAAGRRLFFHLYLQFLGGFAGARRYPKPAAAFRWHSLFPVWAMPVEPARWLVHTCSKLLRQLGGVTAGVTMMTIGPMLRRPGARSRGQTFRAAATIAVASR